MKLTMAQALVQFLAAQEVLHEGQRIPLLGGVWSIFGHGNVGGLGQALPSVASRLPTFRGHDEQAMGHAALGYAKAWRRRRFMAVTTSIGPGATNLVTAAATAHVNRLPLLLLPGDVFADRGPDPVLQQLEHPLGPDVTVNDCLRPVARYFDRIMRPEQLLRSLPEAVRVLMDPTTAGPVVLALPQDVQAERGGFPSSFFARHLHRPRQPYPEPRAMEEAAARLGRARKVLVVAGGGVRYAGAEQVLQDLAERRGWPVAETQAGKGSLPPDHPLQLGGVGVTGTSAANQALAEAEMVLAVGTRLTDFTTGSARLLPRVGLGLVSINVHSADAHKYGAFPVVGDALLALDALRVAPAAPPDPEWSVSIASFRRRWDEAQTTAFAASPPDDAPSDAEVLQVLSKHAHAQVSVVAAAGGLPGDLHKLWRPTSTDAYLVEYGYSCMGHEIAGALGVKMAQPEREVWALVGDGSYLMLSSELATSVAMDKPIIVVVLDNRGFGCIDRLDRSLRGEREGAAHNLRGAPDIDLEGHARALGAHAETVRLSELSAGLDRARTAGRTAVLVVRTDPGRSVVLGGAPWRVPSVYGGR